MKLLQTALLAGAMALTQVPAPANARVCTFDWRPGGGDEVRFYLLGIGVAQPSTVQFKYFGTWNEIIIYDKGEGQILYQGPPVDSFNVADVINVLAFKILPGAMLQVTADWNNPPTPCN